MLLLSQRSAELFLTMYECGTLQQLIDYCAICPVCNKKRYIDITFGPDIIASVKNFEFGTTLTILIVAQLKLPKYQLSFNINTQNNIFKADIPQSTTENWEYDKVIDISSRPQFYFHFYASCKECGQSAINTKDIFIDFMTKTTSNFGVETESRILHDDDMIFHLSYDWENSEINIWRYKDGEEEATGYRPNFSIPIIDLDFSNQEKLITKLKTLHFYS